MPGREFLIRTGGLSRHDGEIKYLFFGLVETLFQPGCLTHALQDLAQAVGGVVGAFDVDRLLVRTDVLGQVLQR